MIHRLDGEYFKRVDAIEFAVKFDDGKNPLGFLKGRYCHHRRFSNVEDPFIHVFGT